MNNPNQETKRAALGVEAMLWAVGNKFHCNVDAKKRTQDDGERFQDMTTCLMWPRCSTDSPSQ